ncbi:unnamed protein product, partial [Iphiclides podalirius]
MQRKHCLPTLRVAGEIGHERAGAPIGRRPTNGVRATHPSRGAPAKIPAGVAGSVAGLGNNRRKSPATRARACLTQTALGSANSTESVTRSLTQTVGREY